MSIDLYLNHMRDEAFKIAEKVKAVSGKEYEVEERLDCGGNAVIHRCVETLTGDEYAVKIQLNRTRKRLDRFVMEIELLRQLKHDQLVNYVDHGTIGAEHVLRKGRNRVEAQVELLFVVMPVADRNLKQLVQQGRSLLYEDYIGQFKGLARALGVLHRKAVHRDIKPENILIKGSSWLLSDFGLCKIHERTDDITSENEPVGPRYWMSPEAVNRAIGNSDEISKRSDVFQLCSVFWFVVTGRHPLGAVSSSDWNGTDSVYSVLADALSHNEQRRPADGSELAQRLDDATLPAVGMPT